MNKENETLKRIQTIEQWLEQMDLLKPLTNDPQLDLNVTRDTMKQVDLYKGESK